MAPLSSGPGLRPLTAAAPVRIRSGLHRRAAGCVIAPAALSFPRFPLPGSVPITVRYRLGGSVEQVDVACGLAVGGPAGSGPCGYERRATAVVAGTTARRSEQQLDGHVGHGSLGCALG